MIVICDSKWFISSYETTACIVFISLSLFIINIIGYVEVMKLLLSHGANVHERTVFGLTAILAAVDGGAV